MKWLDSFILLFLCSLATTTISVSIQGTNSRVVNGLEASQGFFPYIADVQYMFLYMSSAIIISDSWLIIPANVAIIFNNTSVDDVLVTVGLANRMHPEPGSYTVLIDRCVTHSNWTIHNQFVNNIALLHMREPLVFSDIVKAVQLVDTPIDMAKPATMAGWGGYDWIGIVNILNYSTDFQLIDVSYCNDGDFEISPSAICTNSTSPNPASCSGDQGGPLLQFDDTKGMVLHGIVSSPKCDTNFNSFYENIVHHRVWIHLVSGV